MSKSQPLIPDYYHLTKLIQHQGETIREQAGEIMILKSTVEEQKATIRNYQAITGIDPLSVDKGMNLAIDGMLSKGTNGPQKTKGNQS